MPTDLDTSARGSRRCARSWRRRMPIALPAPSGLVRTTPSLLSICTIAGAFKPRTLRGQLHISLDGEEYRLRPGDSFYFESATPHRWKNPGRSETWVLWVNTPPTF